MSSADTNRFIERPGFTRVTLPEAKRPKRLPQHQRRTSSNLVVEIGEVQKEWKRAVTTKQRKLGSKARQARKYAEDMARDEERERIRTAAQAGEAGIL